MQYEITATLGPNSAHPGIWAEMLRAGATAFRLNTSHITAQDLADWLSRLSSFRRQGRGEFSLVLDLQGSKWRLGQFPPWVLREGQQVVLTLAAKTQGAGVLPVPHADFFRAAQGGGEILLNDAKSRLRVEAAEGPQVLAVVELGGEIRPRKGITLSGSQVRQENLGLNDQAMLDVAQAYPFVAYAISYVRDGEEMQRYRALFPAGAWLVAKLERQPALDDTPAIAAHADSVWLCRGDLGAELGIPSMAAAVHGFTALLPSLGVPAYMAGQVLEHMVEHPSPTRSEVCFLYDTLHAGYAGVVLSDECAIGRHPIESIRAAAMFRG